MIPQLKIGDAVFIRTNAGFIFRGEIVFLDADWISIIDYKDKTRHSLAWQFVMELQQLDTERK